MKNEKSGRGRPGRGVVLEIRGWFGNSGVVLEIRTHPDKGRGGWFENPRFWRTSFVDGPLCFAATTQVQINYTADILKFCLQPCGYKLYVRQIMYQK